MIQPGSGHSTTTAPVPDDTTTPTALVRKRERERESGRYPIVRFISNTSSADNDLTSMTSSSGSVPDNRFMSSLFKTADAALRNLFFKLPFNLGTQNYAQPVLNTQFFIKKKKNEIYTASRASPWRRRTSRELSRQACFRDTERSRASSRPASPAVAMAPSSSASVLRGPSKSFYVFACQESSQIPIRSKNYRCCSLWKVHQLYYGWRAACAERLRQTLPSEKKTNHPSKILSF